MVIKKFEEKYFAELLEIERSVFSDAWTEEMFLVEIHAENCIFYVSIHDEKLSGYIIARKILDEVEIFNLAVSPQHRRGKIAYNLLQKIITESKEINKFYLEVRSSNIPAIGLYKKFGFETVSLRRNYYQNPNEDALVMLKLR